MKPAIATMTAVTHRISDSPTRLSTPASTTGRQ